MTASLIAQAVQKYRRLWRATLDDSDKGYENWEQLLAAEALLLSQGIDVVAARK